MVFVSATLLILIVSVIYLLNKYYMRFWHRHGFPQQEPTFLFGDTGPITLGQDTMAEYHEKLYNKTKQYDVFGYYNFYQPTLLINSPELIQRILITDFNHFHDRAVPVDEINDPLSGNLFFLAGQKWRDLRVKLSPTFTSGKLKHMFPIIQDCVNTLNAYLEKNIIDKGKNTFDAKDLFSRFTTNIISSVAFGIENDCINDPDNMFYKLGRRIFEPTLNNTIRNLSIMLPGLYKIFKPKFVEKELETFFVNVVKETIEYREREKIVRNDFMNLLIQLKNQGYVSVDRGDDEDLSEGRAAQENTKKLNLYEISAQALVFFLASFETSSTTMTFCMFELARNPIIQRKLQEEIDELQQIDYESISKSKYLDACIDETLRKYSAVPTLIRESINEYRIPNSNLVIPKGTSIQIPVFGLQRDPDIYDNPLKFQPERFLDSTNGNGKAKGLFYLPFGDGPRNCIGMRLAKLMAKVGIAAMLAKYSFELVDKKLYNEELKLKRKEVSTTVDGCLEMKVAMR